MLISSEGFPRNPAPPGKGKLAVGIRGSVSIVCGSLAQWLFLDDISLLPGLAVAKSKGRNASCLDPLSVVAPISLRTEFVFVDTCIPSF